MKRLLLIAALMISRWAGADGLPVFTSQPVKVTATSLPVTFAFSASATGATSYQWLFNGTNVIGATNATLQISNAGPTNCGYYLVYAINSAGWVPSQMAYSFINYSNLNGNPLASGTLPFSNTNNTYFGGQIGSGGFPPPPTNGTVQVVAGPQLDEMFPIGHVINYGKTSGAAFTNGYYHAADESVPFTYPGQPVYYSVTADFTYGGGPFVQTSTVMWLATGTNGIPAMPAYGLQFPEWPEWPEPWENPPYPTLNQVRVCGETFSLTNSFSGYPGSGTPFLQWRKNGAYIGSPQSFIPDSDSSQIDSIVSVLTITNAGPSDAGVYDVDVRGDDWFISQKIFVSIQATNGGGVFQNPQCSGTNFTCTILGAPTRNYDVQWSTNLVNWTDLVTVSNATGSVCFTNSAPTGGAQFYRTILLP